MSKERVGSSKERSSNERSAEPTRVEVIESDVDTYLTREKKKSTLRGRVIAAMSGEVEPPPSAVSHEDIAMLRGNTIRGHMKFAHIQNRTRRLHIAAATIEHVEAELSYVRNIATWYQQENAKVVAKSAEELRAAEVKHEREMKSLIDENEKLSRRVEYLTGRTEKYKELYCNTYIALSNSMTNYNVLRGTYDRLRAEHPLPAERTFPRRPKRSSDDGDDVATKKTKRAE